MKTAIKAFVAAACSMWVARLAAAWAAWVAPASGWSWGPCVENIPARQYLGFRNEIAAEFAARLQSRKPPVVRPPTGGAGFDAVHAAVAGALSARGQLVGMDCRADGCLVVLATVPEWRESHAVPDVLTARGWRVRPWASGRWGTGHIDDDDREDLGRWEVLYVRDPAVHRAERAAREERQADLLAAMWGAFDADWR